MSINTTAPQLKKLEDGSLELEPSYGDREKIESFLKEYKGKGKVLKVKYGYNPNSSSLGSILFAFPNAVFSVSIAFASLTAFILGACGSRETVEKSEEKEI